MGVESLAENQAAGCFPALRYLRDVGLLRGGNSLGLTQLAPGKALVPTRSRSVVVAAHSPSPCSGVFTSADVSCASRSSLPSFAP